MDVLVLIQELVAKLADAQNQIELIKKEAYDMGFAAGQAAGGAGDKVFTQADVEQMVADALAPLKLEIEALKMEIEKLKMEGDEKVLAAVNAFKTDLLAKYEEMQVIETQAETGFKDLLK